MFLSSLSCSSSSTPTAEQIKADLIGNQITLGLQIWKFTSLSEFESFIINGEQIQGDVLEYDVTMRLRDFKWNELYLLDALIIYKKVNSKWQFTSIQSKLFKLLE
jgi:hypothetical protein